MSEKDIIRHYGVFQLTILTDFFSTFFFSIAHIFFFIFFSQFFPHFYYKFVVFYEVPFDTFTKLQK